MELIIIASSTECADLDTSRCVRFPRPTHNGHCAVRVCELQDEARLRPHRRRAHITNPPVRGVSPGPASAVVEHADGIALAEAGDDLAIVGRRGAQVGIGDEVARQRLGVVRRDHSSGERRVGQILAIGMGRGVGKRRNA